MSAAFLNITRQHSASDYAPRPSTAASLVNSTDDSSHNAAPPPRDPGSNDDAQGKTDLDSGIEGIDVNLAAHHASESTGHPADNKCSPNATTGRRKRSASAAQLTTEDENSDGTESSASEESDGDGQKVSASVPDDSHSNDGSSDDNN